MQNIIYSAKYLWRRYYGLTVAQVSLPVLVLTAFKFMNSTQLCGLSPFSLILWFLKDSFVGSGGGSFLLLLLMMILLDKFQSCQLPLKELQKKRKEVVSYFCGFVGCALRSACWQEAPKPSLIPPGVLSPEEVLEMYYALSSPSSVHSVPPVQRGRALLTFLYRWPVD